MRVTVTSWWAIAGNYTRTHNEVAWKKKRTHTLHYRNEWKGTPPKRSSILLFRSCSFAVIIWPSPSPLLDTKAGRKRETAKEQRAAAGPSRAYEGNPRFVSLWPGKGWKPKWPATRICIMFICAESWFLWYPLIWILQHTKSPPTGLRHLIKFVSGLWISSKGTKGRKKTQQSS